MDFFDVVNIDCQIKSHHFSILLYFIFPILTQKNDFLFEKPNYDTNILVKSQEKPQIQLHTRTYKH